MRLILLGFAFATALAIGAPEAQEPSRGAVLALSCAGCHGTDGRSPGSIPAIEGHEGEDIVSAMQAFRSGARPATVMGRIARGYTDEEIALMAAHFDRLR